MDTNATPRRKILLQFTASSLVGNNKPCTFRESLSALEVTDEGRTLFLGVDETVNATPTIERLSLDGEGYAAHQPLALEDFVDLPDATVEKGRVGEVDIEGLGVSGSFLWVVGSHSSRRKKPKQHSVAEDMTRLASVDLEPNRTLLARIPLVASAGGSTLAKRDGERHSARLVDDLRQTLEDDALLGPFLRTYKNHDGKRVSIPGKDNGFDIEGIVVAPGTDSSNRVLLGLRGPVLRGWATVVEIAPLEGGKHSELVLGPLGKSDKRIYRKHMLRLDGLGIRDLRADGDDILILAGPTMTLNGEVALYRWIGGLRDAGDDTVTPVAPGRLERLLTLPRGDGCDRPEGFTTLPSGELLVVYDSPAEQRLSGEHAVLADVFALPMPRPPAL